MRPLKALVLLLVGSAFLLALLFGSIAIVLQRIASVLVLLFQQSLVTLRVGLPFAKIHGTLVCSVSRYLFMIKEVVYLDAFLPA